MSTIYNDLKMRLRDAGAQTSIGAFHQLREEMEQARDMVTVDECGELEELLAQAFARANAAAVGERKPRWEALTA